MKYLLTLIFIFVLTVNIKSEIIANDVEYKLGDVTFQGYLAYDNSISTRRPGVLIIHQWKGITDYEKSRARQLAEMGYVAFAADIYGKGIRPANNEEAGKQAGMIRSDIPLFRARLNTALAELKMQPLVDPDKIVAIGYCFGGSGVLELARSGADIKGVVSFHGGLKSQNPEDAKNIKARILVLHGAIDPYTSEEDIAAFKKEMNDANVDYIFTQYSGAVHSFTIPTENNFAGGSAYNETADKRSWIAMKQFFEEIF